jgi:hypothetical protein
MQGNHGTVSTSSRRQRAETEKKYSRLTVRRQTTKTRIT